MRQNVWICPAGEDQACSWEALAAGGALDSGEPQAADDPRGPKRPSVDLVTQAKLLEEASTDAQNVHEEDKAALLRFPSGVPAYDRFKALSCVWR